MRRLAQIDPKKEGLGRPTVMDRALAQKHGVPYVHLVVFAIDVDRIREVVDETEVGDSLPMGWEVFLAERWLDAQPEPLPAPLLEDVVLGIFDLPPSDDAVFGSQLSFAIWHAMERGLVTREIENAFRAWKQKPKELAAELDRLYADEGATRRFARLCLDTPIEPPIAPPTREVLEKLAG